MRFTNQLRVWLPDAPVQRKPSLWESVLQAFGASVNLDSAEATPLRNAFALVEGIDHCLQSAGVRNAIALVIDNEVLYQDVQHVPNDLAALVHAARMHAPRVAGGFKLLRAVFEHEEGGVHTVLEATFRGRYRQGEPVAVLSFGGRLAALRPGPTETPAEVRARVDALLADPNTLTQAGRYFEWIVQRVHDGLHHGFPEGRWELPGSVAQLVKPSKRTVASLARGRLHGSGAVARSQPAFPRYASVHRYYDPWDVYYDDPFYVRAELAVIDAMLHAHHHHHGLPVHVIHEDGRVICEADAIAQSADAFQGVHEAASFAWEDASYDKSQLDALGASYANDPTAVVDKSVSSAEAQSLFGNNDCAKDCSSDCSSWDCSKDDGGGKDFGGPTDCSNDCSKDCSTDCSTDCSKDCSSDCVSSDCSKDCSSDCSYDCASSDCASSDCASSDCASSDCSSSSSD